MTEQQKNFTTNNVKWIVIGVISVLALFLFKDELSRLIDRTESVAVSGSGIEITTSTINTVLGETIVSGPPTLQTAGITPDTPPSFQLSRGFMINWNAELWSNNESLAQQNKAELYLLYSIPEGFQPNIMIDSHQGYTSVQAFLDNMYYPDREVTEELISPNGDTGVRVSIGEFSGEKFHYVERIIYNPNSGAIYVAIAERPDSQVGNAALWESTRKVLNSFRLPN